MRRVVITGIGVVSPIGNNVNDFWQNLVAGKSGIDTISSFDPDKYGLTVKIAAEVKNFNPEDYFDKKDAQKFSDFIKFAYAAAMEAMKDADLENANINKDRVGVIVGTGIGGLKDIEEQHDILNEKGARRVSPFFIPYGIANMASGVIAIKYGFRGPNYCVVSACATGNHSIGDAFRIIQRGDADIMIAGGTESAITPLGIAGFASLKALSTRNDEPQKASRPFDKDRDGFVMGEGAGILILEEYEHAKKRGAKIYAEIKGYAATDDAFHVTAPCSDGEGAAMCMRLALEDASLNPEDIDYINAHGTSTPLNDKIETLAIKKVFKDHAYKLKISSNKSMIGHLLGAASAVEAVASVKTIETGTIPPTINLENPDPECDLDYVPNKAIQYDVRNVLSNSFGFGGTNACIILSKVD
ncbi:MULTISPECIES: beta-ketoacyl-ACP synthase II [unclassified Hydrogenobaculum]|uniref:beta-ketoacyl-ACP synthase II n=1 Tax=unclassified Hydrogenobaculum TaxID=2622382 RepID=UPI0001C50D6E|nr:MULTISPECIES: beta-ketoacyl-ACP synthase II [unclassified Hydrogenobaculum]AEF18898.1 3-oxoacyl-(acyl-carrier-protein) synthase 2 [Hydrogenobaculum sp. 3684]AEG46186.1 3-oxoacyl-(acyl-carrier-protein) synthase 2 [Hydrogenobaculum sp. SHO]AGG14831.1 3-oxoacyl-(acyl-carrier-protein) synthase 2 [Hydrogenobaculum sp. HO]AGH93126.1 beta-ketoacyl-acyl-carrier-protein synthase II [Hydrogenobaculum sp. SN]